MKIYSINEFVEATNNIFTSKKNKSVSDKPNQKVKQNEKPLLLKTEGFIENIIQPKIINNKTNINTDVKDHMINELYLYLKKKIRKSTLKLIIDEQLEIKNLRNKVNILKQTEANLKKSYQILKNDHELVLLDNKNLEINKVQLNSEINELRNNNEVLQKNLNQITENKEKLNKEIVQLKTDNNVLHNNLNQVAENNKELDIENKDLKADLNKTKNDLNENIEKNRANEIHNYELKNTVSKYIVNTKKIQEKLNLTEKSNNLNLEAQTKKVKFYQEENVRLSSELLAAQNKNITIKENLNFIETEKEEISNKIKELNKSIDEKSNIIPSNFIKQNLVKTEEKTETLNDKEQKSLDEVINRIFAKI